MATKQISLTEAGKLYRHGTREQLLMDLPAHGKRVGIDLTRKRYRCQNCEQYQRGVGNL